MELLQQSGGIPTARMWRNYACGWFAYVLLLAAAMYGLAGGKGHSGYKWDSLVSLLWVVPQPLVLALLWPLSGWLEQKRPAATVVAHLVGAPVYAALYSGLPALVYGTDRALSYFVWPTFYAVLMYVVIAGIFHGVRLNAARQRQAAAIQQAHSLLLASELNALRSKLNPHFLFNTLHSIIALTRKDPDAAETALFQFSDMLRYVLDTEKNGSDRVTLDDELRFVRDYLELESLRLGPRLSITWELDDAAGRHALPALSLQPLVENSIKHAFNPHSRPGTLHIRTRVDAAARVLAMTVSDDGPGADPVAVRQSNGLGIRTVARRLHLEYGAGAGFEIDTAPGAGFAVTMAIPLDSASGA
jgi:anti-sigma regulatory factor (Ser/Thr protein kinase)